MITSLIIVTILILIVVYYYKRNKDKNKKSPNKDVYQKIINDYVKFENERRPVYDSYFGTFDKIKESKKDNDYKEVIVQHKNNIRKLGDFIRITKEDNRRIGLGSKFDINNIPCLTEGPVLMAVVEDLNGLNEAKQIVERHSELKSWIEDVDSAIKDIPVVKNIIKTVSENPGIKQSDLKRYLAITDGRRIARLCLRLEHVKRIKRVKSGKENLLYPG